jgi:2-desacetyl-2-hydroxyethyl bacteriochlorophyllide A dehydrogenase
MTRARSIHHVAPRKVAVAEVALPPPARDQVLVRSRCSALSAGTESLIYEGRFPPGFAQDGRLASLQGAFEYPFAYGYALVGEVVEVGQDVERGLIGRPVFAFHPHQDYAVVAASDVFPIPGSIAPRAALFLPNMESALGFVMDARPAIGERAMVFGLGVVGLLTMRLLVEFPLGTLVGADPIRARRERATALGARRTIDPTDNTELAALEKHLFEGDAAGLDLAIELSGNAQALNQAIRLTGFDGRVIVGSWYGRGPQALELGSHFHRRRIRLVSSQVSTIDPRLTGRWTRERRIGLAWDAIARLAPEQLITHTVPFLDCERAFALASRRDEDALQVVLEYP